MNLDEVETLLPEIAKVIIDLVGLPTALKLVEAWGGTTFPVSLNKTRSGQIRFEMLAEVVGVDAAEKLTLHFGKLKLYVPKCATALRELRNRRMRADFDTLVDQESANYAVAELARRYGLSDRRIWKILKTPDLYDYPASQAMLF